MKARLEICGDEILVLIQCDNVDRLMVIECNSLLPCDTVPLENNVYQYVVSVDIVPTLVIELLNHGVEWTS